MRMEVLSGLRQTNKEIKKNGSPDVFICLYHLAVLPVLDGTPLITSEAYFSESLHYPVNYLSIQEFLP
jgi:hypothetical protein